MKIGLLPLYFHGYDESSPHVRPRLEAFYEEIAELFVERQMTVEKSGFCRLKSEFEQTVMKFEQAGVDAIVTLHMAYSPSAESVEVLASTSLPIIVLDTTQTLEFTPMQDPGEVMYNHSVHGVIEMCNMLKRYGKPYAIAAGHYRESDCIDRVCGHVRAAATATALQKAHVGILGGAVESIGDLTVDPKEIKERFHITVEKMDPRLLALLRQELTQEELTAEKIENTERFAFDTQINQEEYEQALMDGLALRGCIREKGYTAITANVQKIGPEAGLDTMPFIEICKAMERGIGYAGEGDVLNAAFNGALLASYPDTGFVEIFCPDWKNDMVFLSHTGEVNFRIVDGTPFVCCSGKAVDKRNPYAGYARMKGGKGVYVNIIRGKDDYQLLLSPAEMVSFDTDNFPRSICGWMKPAQGSVAEFLEALSNNGASRHSSFVYGATVEELIFMGSLLSLKTVVI